MKVAKTLRFYGTVQGVNFRANGSRVAASLNLCGWIRNLPDGSVEAHVEGDESAISEMIHICRTDLFPASVEDVVIEDDTMENFTDFRIVR